jgi:hypothetical protein
MEKPTVILKSPVHGTFEVYADALTNRLIRYANSTLFHLQQEVALNVGVHIDPIDGSHEYSDLTRAEAFIVLAYVTGGCAE